MPVNEVRTLITDALVGGLAVWPVVIPLAGSALVLLLRRWPQLQRTVMEVAVALMLVAAAFLLARAQRGDALVMRFGGWDRPFAVTFVGDVLSAALSTAAGVVALAVAIFARADVRARRRRAGFDPLCLGMLAAVNGAFLTGDLFNLYVWFELMLVTALGLLTLDRRRAQIDGALRYAAMSMMGATFMLVGIGLLYGETGTLDLMHMAVLLARSAPSVTSTVAAYLLIAGLVLKAGIFPFLFWLPASYHTAPISVAAALAGLLTKVAFYACLRIVVLVFGIGTSAPVVSGLPPLFAVLAAVTMLVSVLAAIAQVDLRRLLAFHVMGQVAYLVMGLALASSQGSAAAIFYVVHTMLVQAGLFLGAGAIARVSGSYDLRGLGGLLREHPRFSIVFAALALSISGVPPLSGFWAKALVIDAAFRSDRPGAGWLAVVALITGFLTLYSLSLLWSQAFWRQRARHRARPIPVAMVAAVALLAASTLGLGLAIEPAIQLSRAAAGQLISPASLPNGATPAGATPAGAARMVR
jgi:multicomponent Na+:H+ antiporter subunit D